MIGSVIGDIVGSFHEFRDEKDHEGPLFRPESTITDDSILSIATAEAILRTQHYSDLYQRYCRAYPTYGYGGSFLDWAHVNNNYITPNYSWGNGSAMRVSPIGWAFNTPQSVMIEAQQSACITHCHPSGIAGAQATALAIYMARTGVPKQEIYETILEWFEYEEYTELDTLHKEYSFDVSCQGTVPVALACVMQADSFEQVMRNGLYVGGDTDTLLAIAGSIAEPLYGIPENMRSEAVNMLNKHSPALLGMLCEFERKYGAGKTIAEPRSLGGIFKGLLRRR